MSKCRVPVLVDQDVRGGMAIKTTFEKVMEKRFLVTSAELKS